MGRLIHFGTRLKIMTDKEKGSFAVVSPHSGTILVCVSAI